GAGAGAGVGEAAAGDLGPGQPVLRQRPAVGGRPRQRQRRQPPPRPASPPPRHAHPPGPCPRAGRQSVRSQSLSCMRSSMVTVSPDFFASAYLGGIGMNLGRLLVSSFVPPFGESFPPISDGTNWCLADSVSIPTR